MRQALWRSYLLLAGTAIAGYLIVPGGALGGRLPTVHKVAVGWAGAAAVVVGVRRYRPGRPTN